MPSGNFTFTNTGKEAVEVQGQVFEPGQATPVTDNGIADALRQRKDFSEAKPKKAD